MTGATVSRVAGHTVLLTAARSTQYLELEGEEDGNSIEDELGRALTPLATICRLGFSPAFNEVDLVGLVVSVEEGTRGSFLTLFLTDESSLIVRLLVWEGRGPKECFKVFHIEYVPNITCTLSMKSCYKILWKKLPTQEGALVACRDLEWRSHQSAGPLPALYTRENSTLSTNPR